MFKSKSLFAINKVATKKATQYSPLFIVTKGTLTCYALDKNGDPLPTQYLRYGDAFGYSDLLKIRVSFVIHSLSLYRVLSTSERSEWPRLIKRLNAS